MNPLMFLQLPGSLEPLLTNITNEILDFRMSFHVLQQIRPRLKSRPTNIATKIERRLMHFQMKPQTLLRLKLRRANRTLEFLFGRIMNSLQVVPNLPFRLKFLRTFRTPHIWLRSSHVFAGKVCSQRHLLLELFLAQITREQFVVFVHVVDVDGDTSYGFTA